MDPTERNKRFPSAKVFCNPELLAPLQNSTHRPFADSKTLVDLPLQRSPDDAVDALRKLPPQPSQQLYRHVVQSVFFMPRTDDGNELFEFDMQRAQPVDSSDRPPHFVSLIQKPADSLLFFVQDLKQRWTELCRVCVQPHSTETPFRTSLIPLPHPFFIPGGRFRECYYWDTLWIVKGLIACDMLQSAMGVVRNLLYLVDHVGFVPNGNRVYYLNRSQPPTLTQCVQEVFAAIHSIPERVSWLEEALPLVDKEYQWFKETRALRHAHPGEPYSGLALSLYYVDTNHPRPESFKEDFASATEVAESGTLDDRNAVRLFKNLASAAESGWDFSSRWFSGPNGGLSGTQICNIVPCCLNGILLKSERTLSQFHSFLAEHRNEADSAAGTASYHSEKCRQYDIYANDRESSMTKLLWCQEKGFWFDYDLKRERRSSVVSAAGLTPVWAGCGLNAWTTEDAKRFVDFVMGSSGLLRPGGLACTTEASGEQWDFPNSWPPLVDIAVDALRNVESLFPGSGAWAAAEEIAIRFLTTVHAGWLRSEGVMHEKYDCRATNGERGGGGEYLPQTGFGWTNGTVLNLLRKYGSAYSEKLRSAS